jgi:hypothetical protein
MKELPAARYPNIFENVIHHQVTKNSKILCTSTVWH